MKRRDFSLQLAGVAGAAALAGVAASSRAEGPGVPAEGRDYLKLDTPLPEPKDGKIEVIEFFWYGCPHCFAFEATLEPWVARLPADVRFHRVPDVSGVRRETHAKIYYTWEALGLLDQMHAKTFQRFHVEHKPIESEADMLAFAQENGLDVAKVKATWNNGFGMTNSLHAADRAASSYGIDGVPMFGVHGRYTTAPSMGGELNSLATNDYLVNVIRKGG